MKSAATLTALLIITQAVSHSSCSPKNFTDFFFDHFNEATASVKKFLGVKERISSSEILSEHSNRLAQQATQIANQLQKQAGEEKGAFGDVIRNIVHDMAITAKKLKSVAYKKGSESKLQRSMKYGNAKQQFKIMTSGTERPTEDVKNKASFLVEDTVDSSN